MAKRAPARSERPRATKKNKKATKRVVPKATEESERERKKRARRIATVLGQTYPDARCALHHRTPLELLVATILSAQCTDERVNKVTPALFGRYPDAASYASAERAEIEQMIRTTGFFRNKAKSVQGACQKLVHDFGGRVPDTMEDLLRLPGVARKTANVVLGTAFHKATGVVVDTHVFRLAHRMGLSTAKSPDQVEKDLMSLLPQADWIDFSHRMIFHGRQVCIARAPRCQSCTVAALCPQIGVTPAKAKPTPSSRKPLSERIRARQA